MAQLVARACGGDARNIWKDQPATVIKQTLQRIHGIGPGIAGMVVILLDTLEEVSLRPEDYAEMDPKPDVHVRRVFQRLGWCGRNPTERAVIEAARRLYPPYPVKLDGPAWHIGRTWCHAEHPDCGACPMTHTCPRIV
ncbi:MAG: hypothetical protein ACE5HE_03095 [Phycisphaerae bacterium]